MAYKHCTNCWAIYEEGIEVCPTCKNGSQCTCCGKESSSRLCEDCMKDYEAWQKEREFRYDKAWHDIHVLKKESVLCPECGQELSVVDCCCYDEDAWYCTIEYPMGLCPNGAIYCSECDWPW